MRALTVGLLFCVVAVLPLPALAQDAEPPDVVGLSLPEAEQQLDERWLPGSAKVVLVEPGVPRTADADRVVVVAQRVVDRDGVEADEPPAIELTVDGQVPDLLGLTVVGATEELALAGLAIRVAGEDAGGAAEVQEQKPGPGVTLPLGQPVAVRVQVAEPTEAPTVTEPATTDPGTPDVPVPDPPAPDLPLPEEEPTSTSAIRTPLVGLVALVGAALAVARWAQHGRRPSPASSGPLRLRARADAAGQVTTWVSPERPSVAIRLEPQRDRGRQILEEAVHG